MEKPEALRSRASGFSTLKHKILPNYETLIRTEHQLGETYAPRAKHVQVKLVLYLCLHLLTISYYLSGCSDIFL